MRKHVSQSGQPCVSTSALFHALSPEAVKLTCERALGWARKLNMWGFISYLNSPELVAGFQRSCGLVPRDTCSYVSQNGLVHSNGSGKDGPVTIHRRKAEQVANGTSRAHDSNSNYKSASSQYETKGEVSKPDLIETLYSGEFKSRGSRM